MGDEHCIVSCESGRAFAWGANASGQLGIGKIADMPTPQLLPKLGESSTSDGTDVVSIACGNQHTVMATDGGKRCLAFGSNSHGQLGTSTNPMGTEEKQRVLPAVIGVLSNREDGVVQLTAAANHTLALNASGDVYGFGSNSFGQLGFLPPQNTGVPIMQNELRTPGDRQAAIFSPLRVKGLSFFTVRLISTGDTHTLALAS